MASRPRVALGRAPLRRSSLTQVHWTYSSATLPRGGSLLTPENIRAFLFEVWPILSTSRYSVLGFGHRRRAARNGLVRRGLAVDDVVAVLAVAGHRRGLAAAAGTVEGDALGATIE